MNPEMKGFPKNDANYILYFEVVLMSLFLLMNASDLHLQNVPERFFSFHKGWIFSGKSVFRAFI